MNLDDLKKSAKSLKKEINALYLAYKHPQTPWYAKAVAALIVGYALSPVDLIPDFIPVLGYLDDLILIPVGIKFALKLIPPEVMEECRQKSDQVNSKNYIAAGAIIFIWILIVLIILNKFIKG